MMEQINNIEAFEKLLSENMAVLAYYSHDKCSVCKTLKPKLSEYFTSNFPEIKQAYINIELTPDLAAKYSVFTVPVVIVFFEGTESYRKGRSFGIQELADLVERPYNLIFS